MDRLLRIVATLAVLATALPAAARPATTPAAPAAIDAYLRSLVPFGFSGNLIIARRGVPLLARGYGMADREKGVPMTAETPISIGSITKQFTAAAVLLLQERGALHVGDRIGAYLDGVPADKRGITLQQLLTHTAGLRSDYGPSDDEPVGRDAYVARVMAAPLDAPPGSRFEYSNAGYSLLAAIVERVTHEPYERFVHDALFLPAGMRDTGYSLQRAPGEAAVGYREGVRWGTIAAHDYPAGEPYWNLLGNGGIVSTPGDMLRWDRALAAGTVLSKRSVAALQTGYVSEDGGGGPPSMYGYGWSIERTPHGRLVTHNGGNGIFAADFLRYVDDGTTIYIASNDSRAPATMLGRRIARILFGESAPEPAPAVMALDAAHLAAVSGTYAADSGATVTLAPVAGALAASTSDPALFAALQPVKPLPQRLHDDVTPRALALLAQGPAAAEGVWGDFLRRNGRLENAHIVAYTAIEQDIGVWIAGTLAGKPVFVRMRFGPERMIGLIVSPTPPSVAFLPQSPTRFVAYFVPAGWSSTLSLSENGLDITTVGGDVVHLRRANAAAGDAPTQTQRLAAVEPDVALASPIVTVPMRVDRWKPSIEVMLDGKGPFRFGIETGAPFVGVRQRVLDALGLHPVAKGEPPLFRVASLDAGGMHVSGLAAIATEAADPSIDGVLGLNVFASLLTTLDYPGGRLSITRGSLPEPNGRDVLATVPVAFGFGVRLGIGATEADAFIDTRSEGALGVAPEFAGRLRFAHAPVQVGMARGAAFAPVPVKAARLDGDVRLGEYTLARPIIEVRQLPSFLPSAPLLGGRVLSQFVVTLDQRGGRVRFERPDGSTRLAAPPPAPWEQSSAAAPAHAG